MPSQKEIYSTRVKAGRKTYFFSVTKSDNNGPFLKLTESRHTGEEFEETRILIDKEYGEAFLEALTESVRRLINLPDLKDKTSLPEKAAKTYSLDDKREAHANAYTPWKADDDEHLEKMFCEGMKRKEIAALFGRKPSAISSRIKKLELKEKYGR